MVLKARAPLPVPITFPKDLQECSFKACFLDVYYGKNHLDCYNFCQKSKDHFASGGAKSSNQILFAVFFLRNCMNFRWQ